MTRDEIRKKWQNGEFVGKQSEDNIAEGATLRPSNQRALNENKNVWQQVMDRTEQMMNMNSKIANQEMADSNKKTAKDNIWHVAKRTGAGIFSTLTGQVSGAVTDTANQLQKGEKRSKGAALLNAADTLLAPDNVNIMNATREANRENIEILKDKDKNAWEKLAGVAMNTTSSAINAMPFKRKTNAVIQAVGSIFKDKELSQEALKANDTIRKPSQEFNQRLAEESKEYGRGTRIAGDVMQTVGGMVPSMVSSAVTGDPTASLLSLGLGAKGNATNEALDKGVSLEDAVKRGDTDMMVEIGTEKLSSGVNIFGKGVLDKVNDKMMKIITSKVGRFLLKEGLDVAEESLEEVVSDVAGNLLDKGTTDPDTKIWNWGDELKTVGLTILTTTVLKILTGGHLQDYNEISRELQSEFEKENGTENINQEQNDVEGQKNTEPEGKQATTIENKPLLQQEQQTNQVETKEAKNENIEQTEEIEEKEEGKPKSLLIKPKLDNELNKERAKNILGRIQRNVQYKENKSEQAIQEKEAENKKARTDLINNIDDYATGNNVNREQIKHIKNNAIEQGIDAEKFKSLSKEEIEGLMNDDIPKYKEENKVQETKPKTREIKLPEAKTNEKPRTLKREVKFDDLPQDFKDEVELRIEDEYERRKDEAEELGVDISTGEKRLSTKKSDFTFRYKIDKDGNVNITGVTEQTSEDNDWGTPSDPSKAGVTDKDLNLLDQERNRKQNAKKNQKSDSEMVEYLNDVDRRTDNAKKNIKAQEQEEKANAVENKELNVSEDEERQRRYEKEGIKEHNKKQKEEGKEYAGNDDSFDKTRDYDRLDRINKKTLKKDNIKKSLDKALDSEEFRKEITKRGNISDKNYTLTKEDIYEDAGHLNNAINYMFEQNKANKEARLLEENDVKELLKQDAAAYDEFDNEYNQRIQQAVQSNEEQDTGTTRREVNKALDEKADNEDVETLDTTDMDKTESEEYDEDKALDILERNYLGGADGTTWDLSDLDTTDIKEETPSQELLQQAKPNNQAPTTEELNDISRQQRNERKQQRKETWTEANDRMIREKYGLDEDYWNSLEEDERWVYRNKRKNSSTQRVESDIRNNIVERVEQSLNKSKTEDDVIGILDGDVTAENVKESLTAKELWEEYKEQELNLNNENNDLTFETFDGKMVSTREKQEFERYLGLVSPERFIKDLKNAVAEKNKTDFKNTYGISEPVYNKALNVKDAQHLAENEQIIDALALNDDQTKYNTLVNLGRGDVVSKADFIANLKDTQHTPDYKNIDYTRYLNEKLRRLVYDKVNEQYDLREEFTAEQVRSIRALEQEVATKRTVYNRYRKIAKDLAEKGIDVFTFKEKMKGVLARGVLEITAPIRINETIFDKDTANKLNEEFFDPLFHDLAEKNRYQDRTYRKIESTGILDGGEDSHLLFELIEGHKVKNGKIQKAPFSPQLLLKELNGDKERSDKIVAGEKILRSVYDEAMDMYNSVMIEEGLQPLKKRKHYITHIMTKNQNNLGEAIVRLIGSRTQEDKFNAINEIKRIEEQIDEDEQQLENLTNGTPNSTNNELTLEGIEQNKPSSPFAKSRKGKMEGIEADAIKASKLYIRDMSDAIFLTKHVQKFRTLEKLLMQVSSMDTIRDEEALIDLDNITEEQKKIMQNLKENGGMSEYVRYIDSYINSSLLKQDRIKDADLKKVVDTTNKIVGRFGKNVINFNFGSALTNFTPLFKTLAQTSPQASLRALGQMTGEIIGRPNDGLLDKSDFYVRRFGADINLSDKTLSERYNDIGASPQSIVDKVAAEFIIRAKYNEGLSKYKKKYTDSNGNIDYDKLQQRALKYSGDYGSRTMSERTQGTVPLAFENKALKGLTQFQIEATSDFNNFIHDLQIQGQKDIDELGYSEARAKAGVVSKAISTMVLMNIFNNVFEEVVGNRPVMDLLEIMKIAAGYDKDDDDDEDENTAIKILKKIAGLNKTRNNKEVTENLYNAGKEFFYYIPFINLLSDNSRIPTGGAISDIFNDTKDLLKNLAKSETRPNAAKNAKKVLKNSVRYFLLPGGGVQANRIAETVQTYRKGGSYNDNGQLRYPVQDQDKAPVRTGQSLLFGTRTLPTAKEYSRRYKESGKGALSEKNTELYNSLDNVSYKEFTDFVDTKSEDKTLEEKEKMRKLRNMGTTQDDKWKLFSSSLLEKDQAEKAETIISDGLSTKKGFMDKYENNKERKINLPSEETIEKMKENDISYDLYSKYENDLKNMQDEQDRIKNTTLLLTGKDISKEKDEKDEFNVDTEAKIEVIRNDKYSDDEREKLYTTLVLGNGEENDKKRTKYNNFKKYGTGNSSEINKYLDYVSSGMTKKQELLDWFADNDLTPEQEAYLYATKGYKMTNTYRKILNGLGLNLSDINGKYKNK